MFYGYNNENIVIFDLSYGDTWRDHDDNLVVPWQAFDYAAMEKIKDGLFFNTKYESVMKYRLKPAHVIVFANGDPQRDRLAADRWDVRPLSKELEEFLTSSFFSDLI